MSYVDTKEAAKCFNRAWMYANDQVSAWDSLLTHVPATASNTIRLCVSRSDYKSADIDLKG